MAKCTRCGKDVGCGCNLNKGLCSACYAIVNAPKPQSPPPPKKVEIDVDLLDSLNDYYDADSLQ